MLKLDVYSCCALVNAATCLYVFAGSSFGLRVKGLASLAIAFVPQVRDSYVSIDRILTSDCLRPSGVHTYPAQQQRYIGVHLGIAKFRQLMEYVKKKGN
jgi:hypothetical protein